MHRVNVKTTAGDTPSVGVTVSFVAREGKSRLKTATWAAKQNSAPSAAEQAAQPGAPAASWCMFWRTSTAALTTKWIFPLPEG